MPKKDTYRRFEIHSRCYDLHYDPYRVPAVNFSGVFRNPPMGDKPQEGAIIQTRGVPKRWTNALGKY